MRNFTMNLIAGGIGAAVGYAFYQKQHAEAGPPGEDAADIVVAAPLANVGAAALAGLMLGSPVAALMAGFTISATTGAQLDQMLRDLAGNLG